MHNRIAILRMSLLKLLLCFPAVLKTTSHQFTTRINLILYPLFSAVQHILSSGSSKHRMFSETAQDHRSQAGGMTSLIPLS